MRTKTIISSVATAGILASFCLSGIAYACAPKNGDNGGKPSNTKDCLSVTDANSFVADFTRGTGTITTKDGVALCSDTTLTLESFTLPDTWDGAQFNSTALPQIKFAETSFTFPGNQSGYSKTLTIAVPDSCKPTQIDFYFDKGYDKLVGLHDDDARYIYGLIFKGEGTCKTTPTETPTPPKQTTPAPTTPVTPAVTTPAPQGTGKSAVVEAKPVATVTPTTLPNTGVGDLALPFGVATTFGTAIAYLKQRFSRR